MQASFEIYSSKCQLLLGWAEQLHHSQQKFENDDVTKNNDKRRFAAKTVNFPLESHGHLV